MIIQKNTLLREWMVTKKEQIELWTCEEILLIKIEGWGQKQMKYIIFGFEHYNPLGIARSLGENGITPAG